MKYFFFDIDGTLLHWKYSGTKVERYFPDSAKLALQKLKENGYFLAIATGRSYSMSRPYLDELDIDNMVFDGGNGICLDREFVSTDPLDREKCLALINECNQKGIPWAFSPDIEGYRICPDNSFIEATHDEYVKNIVVDGLNINDYPAIYKMYIACATGQEKQLTTLDKLPWCRYHTSYFFVEPCNKAIGIKKMVDHFHGNYQDVVVFGDELNDVSMFQDNWTKIAMGNANPKLKELADYVTTPIDQDGIYNACVHFGWIKDELS